MTTAEPATAEPGFFIVQRPFGFTVYICACQEHFRRVRALVQALLRGAGIDEEVASDAELVASELMGNAIRACGDLAPLVVETRIDTTGVWVSVHDPLSTRLPQRSETTPDDADQESGRGLRLLDTLAPGWHVRRTPIGKQIRCHLSSTGADRPAVHVPPQP